MSYASLGSVPCSKWPVDAREPQMLQFTHLLFRPPPESGSPGTDKLCLGKSGRMGAGRLHAVDPTPGSGPGNKLKSMCLSGRGNPTVPCTLVWRRSQHGTEQGLAMDDSSEGASVKAAVSGMSQVWAKDIIQTSLEGMKRKENKPGKERRDKKVNKKKMEAD